MSLNEIDLGDEKELLDLAIKLGIPNPEDVVEISVEDAGNGKVRMVALYSEGKRQHPDRIEL